MILKNKTGQIAKSSSKGVFIKLAFIKYVCVLCVIVLIAIGMHKGSQNIQTKGYNGLFDFISTIASNYWNGKNAQPENISIEIKEKDIKKLEKYRAQALERGVIINDVDGDYVPATLEYQHKKLKIKLRLKGHMTDHLQNNKWSFRIKIQDSGSFMGMRRFSIQHPGTRGYIYEWIYHEMMKREDIIALRYKFLNVVVNGKDWGIYAVEENFDQELITNNHRKKGPIIRFNPDLYWVNRYNEIKHFQPVAEFASYYSANPEAYRENDVLKDSSMHYYYLKALGLMEGFRCKKIPADQAFDIPRLAKFHAIIDLVGGQHSIDWSDIKYFYNPVTARLEPVAYESFTGFPFESIAGNYKYMTLDSNQNYEDLHTALFSNPVFFCAYIKELERISEPVYLHTFFKDVNEELKNNLAILYKEFPYKKFDPQNYYENQIMIKKILDPPKSFHAYLNDISKEQVCLQIGAIESLPIEIKSVKVGNVELHASGPIILSAKQYNEYIVYKKYYFYIPEGMVLKNDAVTNITVNYSILGASTIKQENVFLFPHTTDEFVTDELRNKQSTVTNFSFLKIDDAKKIIWFKPGEHKILSDLVIPAGYKVIADEQVSLDLLNKSKIISYSAFLFLGTEDESIMIQSSDLSGQGIELIDAPGSVFKNVCFKNLPEIMDKQWGRKGYVTCYESKVEFNACRFYDGSSKNALTIIRSDFLIKECLFQNMKSDALQMIFSKGAITSCVFENCEKAIDAKMSNMDLNSLYVNGATVIALNFKEGSQAIGRNILIKRSHIGIGAEGFVNINLKGVSMMKIEEGVVTSTKSDAVPVINLSELTTDQVKKAYTLGNKATVIVNGKSIEE